jgi:hypothetical protein
LWGGIPGRPARSHVRCNRQGAIVRARGSVRKNIAERSVPAPVLLTRGGAGFRAPIGTFLVVDNQRNHVRRQRRRRGSLNGGSEGFTSNSTPLKTRRRADRFVLQISRED